LAGGKSRAHAGLRGWVLGKLLGVRIHQIEGDFGIWVGARANGNPPLRVANGCAFSWAER
jgi:hypothetical protein